VQNPPDEQLKRTLGLFPLTNIVVANMIGAGIFTTSGLLMSNLGNPVLLLLLWLAGGLIALCGALCYGELGAAIPRAGGEYVYLSRLFHPLVGFLSGWVSFIVGFSAPIAASAMGFSEYVFRAFPHFLAFGGAIDAALSKKILSIIAVTLFTLIHLRGIKFGATIQNYLTLLKLALISGLIMAGFLLGSGSLHHLSEGNPFTFDFGGWKTIGLSLTWIMFAYSGWNASGYIGSEITDPTKNLPRSLLLGTGIVMALYLCLNVFYVFAVSPESMKGVVSIGGLAVKNAFGASMEGPLSILIAFALFSSLSAFIILGPRVYYSMAKDGLFFKFVADVHPVYNIPAKAILVQGLISVLMVLSGTFDQILTYMGFSLGIFPILTILGVFKLRHSGKSSYIIPAYPLVPAIYIASGLIMLILTFFERPLESSIALLTVILGIPAYIVFRKIHTGLT
jgi:APA family basic amino acid/polyamine antiporter